MKVDIDTIRIVEMVDKDGFGANALAFYGEELNLICHFVHCDPLVLHAPGACDFCDKFGATAQSYRGKLGVNFTGENDPTKRPCPAEIERGAKCQIWGGNRPKTFAQQDEEIAAIFQD